MAISALRWAWAQPISPTQKLILVRLADLADEAGVCWPSLARLEQDTGFTRRGITLNLKALEADGFLKRNPGGPGHGATRYTLKIGRESGSLGNGVPYESGSLGNDVPQGRESGSLDVGNDVPTIPHKNPKRSPNKIDHAKCDQRIHDLFGRWYELYPLKKGRGQALKAFTKLNPSPEQVEAMIAAVESQKADRLRRQAAGEWVPDWKHPATWINGECWADETEPAPGEAPASRPAFPLRRSGAQP